MANYIPEDAIMRFSDKLLGHSAGLLETSEKYFKTADKFPNGVWHDRNTKLGMQFKTAAHYVSQIAMELRKEFL